MVSIAFLAELEKQLRQEMGRDDLVLADVFDLVAGTSVGSMIATMVSLGYPVADIKDKFEELAPKIFSGRMTMFGQRTFNALPLVNGVRSIVKNDTLASDRLRTGLGIVAKRVDTGAVWLLTNNPNARYWETDQHFKLESLIRASTAAPLLFSPAKIDVVTDGATDTVQGLFVDGGVSPHNNPSLLILMVAGLPAYGLNWTLGRDDLLMISIGTGTHRSRVNRKERVLRGIVGAAIRGISRDTAKDIEEAAFAAKTLRGMVNDGAQLVLKTLQSVSNPRIPWPINTEVAALEGQLLMGSLPFAREGGDVELLRFQRYDLPLEAIVGFPDAFDAAMPHAEREKFHPIDEPAHVSQLYALAAEAAAKQVSVEDLRGFL